MPVYIVASLLPQFRCASFGDFHCLPPCMPNSLLPHLGVQVLTVLLLTIFFVTIVLLCKFCRFINSSNLKHIELKKMKTVTSKSSEKISIWHFLTNMRKMDTLN